MRGIVNCSAHFRLVRRIAALRARSADRLEQIHKLHRAVIRTVGSLLVKTRILCAVVARYVPLQSILLQPDNFRRIHGCRTRVSRIKVNIKVKEYVVHRKRRTVRELNAVFNNEVVFAVSAHGFHFVIFYDNRFFVTERELRVLVRRKHTDLRLPHYVHIRTRRGIEGIKQSVQILRHDIEGVRIFGQNGRRIVTARKRHNRADGKNRPHRQRNATQCFLLLTHIITSEILTDLFIDRFDRNGTVVLVNLHFPFFSCRTSCDMRVDVLCL